VLEVNDVHKAYRDVHALNGLSLSVDAGAAVALLGPNGAGKTTLISCIAGLRKVDSGAITVDGIDAVRDSVTAQARIGLAPQETGVYEALTVRENLAFFCELIGLRGAARSRRIDEVAEPLALHGLLDRSSQRLSGGEKRRLHTAIALVHDAPLLLLDEPTVGADVATRSALLEVVRSLVDEGTAVLYSTHYFPEVHALGATVAIVDQGRLIATGTPDELVAEHADAAIELTFDGPAPVETGLAHATAEGDQLRVPTDEPAAALADILVALGADTARLRGVELLEPDLDAVFLSLTGRRYESAEEGS
jgi:ABC-2 type transport system ATP-binding protein